jgi:hypothetical protein
VRGIPRRLPALLAWGLAACGAGAAASGPIPLSDACLVASTGLPLRDSLSVALTGPLGAAAPQPWSSPAGLFLAAQLGRDSSASDCAGRPLARGLGAFRLIAGDSLLLVPGDTAHALPVIRIQVMTPGDDPRDWVDRGTDVVLTADPATLEYAARRGELRLVPLAWSSVYVLLSSPELAALLAPSVERKAELARDAVRAEAQPAEGSYWWERAECARPAAGPPVPIAGIATVEGDPVARALAERLVAISPASGPRRVLSYPAAKLDSGLALGGAAAAILALPRSAPRGCDGLTRIPAGWTLTPLVETRATAVLRPGVPPLLLTADGTIRFVSRTAP